MGMALSIWPARWLGRRVSFRGVLLSLLIIVFAGSQPVKAQVLSLFRYEDQAQRHCPGDTIVWLDFRTQRYYAKGQRRYASGSAGSFVCRNEARGSGYRRSPLGVR